MKRVCHILILIDMAVQTSTFKDSILHFRNCYNSYANILVGLLFLPSRFCFQQRPRVTKSPSYFKWAEHYVRTNYNARVVSCSILYVYRSRRSTSLLVSRKKRRSCTCVRWYADCGSQSRLGTSFLGYDGRLFIDARKLSNAALSSSSNYWFIEGMRKSHEGLQWFIFIALSTYSGVSIIPFLCRIRLDYASFSLLIRVRCNKPLWNMKVTYLRTDRLDLW